MNNVRKVLYNMNVNNNTSMYNNIMHFEHSHLQMANKRNPSAELLVLLSNIHSYNIFVSFD